jgi:DDE family transposase
MGRGPRPRSQPDWLLADRAYGARGNRAWLARRGVKAAIPIKTDQARARLRKGRAGGRPADFDTQRYRDRNTVERAVNNLRETRAVGTRYDKRDYSFRGTITVSVIRIWLRDPAMTTLPNTLGSAQIVIADWRNDGTLAELQRRESSLISKSD